MYSEQDKEDCVMRLHLNFGAKFDGIGSLVTRCPDDLYIYSMELDDLYILRDMLGKPEEMVPNPRLLARVGKEIKVKEFLLSLWDLPLVRLTELRDKLEQLGGRRRVVQGIDTCLELRLRAMPVCSCGALAGSKCGVCSAPLCVDCEICWPNRDNYTVIFCSDCEASWARAWLETSKQAVMQPPKTRWALEGF